MLVHSSLNFLLHEAVKCLILSPAYGSARVSLYLADVSLQPRLDRATVRERLTHALSEAQEVPATIQ